MISPQYTHHPYTTKPWQPEEPVYRYKRKGIGSNISPHGPPTPLDQRIIDKYDAFNAAEIELLISKGNLQDQIQVITNELNNIAAKPTSFASKYSSNDADQYHRDRLIKEQNELKGQIDTIDAKIATLRNDNDLILSIVSIQKSMETAYAEGLAKRKEFHESLGYEVDLRIVVPIVSEIAIESPITTSTQPTPTPYQLKDSDYPSLISSPPIVSPKKKGVWGK